MDQITSYSLIHIKHNYQHFWALHISLHNLWFNTHNLWFKVYKVNRKFINPQIYLTKPKLPH